MEVYGLVGGDVGHVGVGERGHVGRVRVWDAGGETLYGTLKTDTVFGNGGDDRIYGFEGNDLLRGNLGNDAIYAGFGNDRVYGGSGSEGIHDGNDETVGYVDCDPGHDRVYLDDKNRYTPGCEMITPVDSHPRSERAGAG
jgi:Ca2+-binding RTX toxin-like protein